MPGATPAGVRAGRGPWDVGTLERWNGHPGPGGVGGEGASAPVSQCPARGEAGGCGLRGTPAADS